MTDKPAVIQRGGSRESKAPDQETSLWHGREPAAALVKRYSMSSEEVKVGGGGQGLLLGVVFPCMANILGVLLFLRLPWIVGKAGVFQTFCLVLVCCSCTFVTALSMSAVATNGKIMAGGSYYLISRSLGPALGAGVGLCFYMANSIGAAMYFMGTVEAWEIAQPNSQILEAGDINNIRVTGFCILGAALIIVAGGVKLVAKLGTVFLFIVLGVILCMYLGCLIGPGDDNSYDLKLVDVPKKGQTKQVSLMWSGPSGSYFSDNFGPSYDSTQWAFPKDTTEHNFISLMALWFPAVTGIMAGSNRSADLKDPAGDIPRGTLFAQNVTSVIYLSFVLLYGAVAPRESLLHDKFFAATASWPLKEIVTYGVMASTIGAGLTSLVSGTRLLSAIAGDGTLPILRVFAAKRGSEPRLALLASGVLCALAVAIGELNAVAPILTMFFLMCYTCINMSCTIMELVQDPNWRPTFRFHHWSISVIGAILCVWMMFAISWFYAMIAIIFCSMIFVYATHNSHEVKWGDGWQGMKFQLARNILTKMDITAHTKNWRPQLLVITRATIAESDVKANEDVVSLNDPEMLNLASQLKGGRGITILGGVCTTKGTDVFSDGGLFVAQEQRQRVLDGQDTMNRLLKKFNIEGFGRIVYTHNFSAGLMSLVQIAGLGAFQPNCVVTAWPKLWLEPGPTGHDARAQMIRMVQVAVVFNKVMLISKGAPFPELDTRLTGNTDIWWIVADGGILLLLSHLLMKHPVWRRCNARLFAVADQVSDDPEQVKTEIQNYVKDFRLNIEVHVVVIDPNIDGELQAEAQEQLMREAERVAKVAGKPSEVAPIAPIDVIPEIDEQKLSKIDEQIDEQKLSPRSANVYALDDLMSGSVTYPKECLLKSERSDPLATRQISGDSFPKKQPSTSSFGSGVAKWRKEARRITPTNEKGTPFPNLPPSNAVETPKSGELQPPGPMISGPLTLPSKDGPSKIDSRAAPSRDVMFLHSGEQLSSNKAISVEELMLAKGLNRLILQESKEAELVITNLPDMPPGESALGYCQLVNSMTEGVKRCFLVRGTASEVITAFT